VPAATAGGQSHGLQLTVITALSAAYLVARRWDGTGGTLNATSPEPVEYLEDEAER
jgi:hypothetical protein